MYFFTAIREQNREIPFILFADFGCGGKVNETLNNAAGIYLQKSGNMEEQYAMLAQRIKQATGEKRAVEVLCESELRFRLLIQKSSEIIRILDKGGRILFYSPSSSTIPGYLEG